MVKTDLQGGRKMGFFRKKKEEERSSEKEIEKPQRQLEKLCEKDLKLYQTFSWTLHLDPPRIGVSWEELIKKAKQERKQGNIHRAWNTIIESIQIALWEGKKEKLKKAVNEALREDFKELHEKRYLERGGRLESFLKDPEKTLSISQEYYRKKKEDHKEKEEEKEEE